MAAGNVIRALAFGALVLLGTAGTACASNGDGGKPLVIYAYSGMETVMRQAIIPAFKREWKQRTGQEVRVLSAFAGSGTITTQIAFGAPAQVAMVSTEMDVFILRDAGMVTTDWRSFDHQGTYAYTTAALLTRKGKSQGIRSFEDATKPGIEVVYPDPTTSGGAQWAILAFYGSILKTSESATGVADTARAAQLLDLISLNAGSLPESARQALTQFGLGYGDMLLTYENEALLDIANGKAYEIVVPVSTIYIEPKVIIVDKNVKEGDSEVVNAFVDFLWSHEAQEAFARSHFRVWDEEIMRRYASRYQEVEMPFTVDYLGGWEEATVNIIDQAWRQARRGTR